MSSVKTKAALVFCSLFAARAALGVLPATGPLHIGNENPRYFGDDTGKAIFLTGSHTWANLQDIGITNPTPALQAQVGRSPSGAERQATTEQKARRIVGEELKRRGGREASLSQLRKGDAGKVPMARRLRAETTVTLPWIAATLAMGTWTHVANLLSPASLPA